MYIGSKIQILEKVDSTNEFLKNNASIYPDGAIVIAKVQSHGRGRFARKWISDIRGNLYCSIIVKDTTWLKHLTHLPIFISVVLRRAIVTSVSKNDERLQFKWPNDILGEGAKLAGILIESVKDFFIIGIGLNIIKAPVLGSGSKATSITDLFPLREEVEPVDFVNVLKGCYNAAIKEYISDGFDKFRREWESYCAHLNKKVDLNEGIDDNTPTKQTVLFKGLNADGGAVVVNDSGEEKIFYYGEITQ